VRVAVAILAVLALAACPKKQTPATTGGDDDDLPADLGPKGETEPPPPTTELQQRQYAACERVIPRETACAVQDAKEHLSPEEYKKQQIDETAPIHTREYIKKCKNNYMSSRQVRVYEVCDREETECGPLVECLQNAKPEKETP